MSRRLPAILPEMEALKLREQLARLTDWELRVLASMLFLTKVNEDMSDLAGSPARSDMSSFTFVRKSIDANTRNSQSVSRANCSRSFNASISGSMAGNLRDIACSFHVQ